MHQPSRVAMAVNMFYGPSLIARATTAPPSSYEQPPNSSAVRPSSLPVSPRGPHPLVLLPPTSQISHGLLSLLLVAGEAGTTSLTVPDTTDRQTLLALAKMTSNAYYEMPGLKGWWGLDGYKSTPFGWGDGFDGLRGHIFADEKNETVVIAIKGTSMGFVGDRGGPSTRKDRFNENLLFSCCCARQAIPLPVEPVCDCSSGGNTCGETCLEDAVAADSVYAAMGTNLYNGISSLYPDANIWLVGHSLGGAIASLIALSFGAPAVAFEAPGDLLAARRLHLPLPPGMPAELTSITHVYHTADPIAMGVCNRDGYPWCYAAGFVFESKCHTGQSIIYDTATYRGWSYDIQSHTIKDMIHNLLSAPWVERARADTNRPVCSQWRWIFFMRIWQCHFWVWVDRVGDWLRGVKVVPGEDPEVGASGWWDGDKHRLGDGRWEVHGGVPVARVEEGCVDCSKW
ncbi:hypothetical protein IAT38_001885 [Cryptococcus sp. DSM 104549]